MIKVSELSKIYRSANKSVHALSGINLIVEKGDIYGIIGLSGAGKSTLIRCLSTLLEPSSGTIYFNGIDLCKMTKRELRNFRLEIGMVFQHFNLFTARTVEENVAYPLEIAKMPKEKRKLRVAELLELVGLSAKAQAYPALLSGGEKQRVGIARALANEPKVLFCDEATSSLDPKTTKEILSLLKIIQKKLEITIVLITHDMEVIKRICNKVAVIQGGQIIEQGLVSQVFGDPEHSLTKHFIQSTSHEIPIEFFKPFSPNRKLLRLRFKEESSGKPLISQIAKKFQVEINILLGWIDYLQTVIIGTLIVEMTGSPEGIKEALSYLNEHDVRFEVLEHGF